MNVEKYEGLKYNANAYKLITKHCMFYKFAHVFRNIDQLHCSRYFLERNGHDDQCCYQHFQLNPFRNRLLALLQGYL